MSFISLRALSRVSLAALVMAGCSTARAEDEDEQDKRARIVVTGHAKPNSPATDASIDAERIDATVNAANVEDGLKYLPSLVVRKRHIGDTQSPLATRTSGLGSSARSLIYADGALLSALIGNNNTVASPRWGLVSPQEIERIQVLYGPFSAAYPGNSMGAVVNITTRMPEKLEGTASALVNLQDFRQYGTDRLLPTYQFGATIGGRLGPLSIFASAAQTASKSHPLSYITAARSTATAGGTPATGGIDALNRTGGAVRVLGAGGIEDQKQGMFKLKAALDLGAARLTYTGGLFLDDTEASAETYLRAPSGAELYSGVLNIGGAIYNVPANAFSSGIYTRQSRHWSHSLSASGSGAVDWQVIGTAFDFDRDVQRTPSTGTGGGGQIVRLEGTGWRTLDARATGRGVSAGAHWDRFAVNSNRYSTSEWRRGGQGARNQASRGKTETFAAWTEGRASLASGISVTLGGRLEWWRAFGGYNFSAAPALAVAQPERRAQGLSPKASIAWQPAPDWSLRLSAGKAYRFPTVGELYQAVTTGATITVPDPNLRPERAWSQELALEHRGTRISLFNESVEDALISQSAPLLPGSTTLFNYVQNVDRTRARGVEVALDRRDLLPGVDLLASATYTDAETRKNTAFPGAVGKMLPSVPRWKATAAITWRPMEGVSLTTAARYASRNYGSLDNSDVIGNTWQGFYKYLVVDARALFRMNKRMDFAIGVDNLTNDRYFLFHPFPQRSLTAEVTLRL
ncbi:TonB-dependent receptor [Sphingomonas sp.]|jgi:iron complex outermembrane receptor protein|uniref:TonB-dependent receptor n=1 Tax=Sphingomonas sp. TaxID=28214 RepID=UPI002ED7ACEE